MKRRAFLEQMTALCVPAVGGATALTANLAGARLPTGKVAKSLRVLWVHPAAPPDVLTAAVELERETDPAFDLSCLQVLARGRLCGRLPVSIDLAARIDAGERLDARFLRCRPVIPGGRMHHVELLVYPREYGQWLPENRG
ncbi:MAG: hypothetical protein IT495_08040 [Gammaproteobacteria bacterium]|nr:hypothetical protein [Gammaproteobacteria bacterium]